MNNIQHIELLIDDIILLDENPREITQEDLEKLADDLENDPTFLHQRPSLINKVNDKFYCYAGTQRIKAQKLLGKEKAICFVEENVPEHLQKQRMLKDNLHRGKWDEEKLLELDFEIPELLDIGFDEMDLNIFKEDDIPYPTELTAPKKDNPPTMRLTFTDSKQIQSFEKDLKIILEKEKYTSITYSISQGEI